MHIYHQLCTCPDSHDYIHNRKLQMLNSTRLFLAHSFFIELYKLMIQMMHLKANNLKTFSCFIVVSRNLI